MTFIEMVLRVRSLYTTGHGEDHIKRCFNLSDNLFHTILRGDYTQSARISAREAGIQ